MPWDWIGVLQLFTIKNREANFAYSMYVNITSAEIFLLPQNDTEASVLIYTESLQKSL